MMPSIVDCLTFIYKKQLLHKFVREISFVKLHLIYGEHDIYLNIKGPQASPKVIRNQTLLEEDMITSKERPSVPHVRTM